MNPITKYVLTQLDSMHQTPEMYGSKESVELQYLQYLETWVVSVCPDLDASEPRLVLNMYQQHRVQKGFPATQPLSEVLPSSRVLVDVLQEFRSVLGRKLDEAVKCTVIRDASSFEHTPLSVAAQAIRSLIDENEFLGYQLAAERGAVSEEQLEELSKQYLKHHKWRMEDLVHQISLLVQVVPDRVDSELVGTVFHCDVVTAGHAVYRSAEAQARRDIEMPRGGIGLIRAMSDFEPTPPKDTRPGKLLAVFHEGVLTLLEHQGNDLEIEVGNMGEDGLLESVGDPPAPGVWVWSGGFIDGGEGDWPGTREYVLDGEWAPASKEEWSAFQRGDWTWGEPPPTTQRIL